LYVYRIITAHLLLNHSLKKEASEPPNLKADKQIPVGTVHFFSLRKYKSD